MAMTTMPNRTVRHDGSAHYLLYSLCSESVGLFQASQLMSQNIVYAQTLKADVFIFPGTNPWSEGGL